MISLRDLSIGYRDGKRVTYVASGISADIRPGEMTCLIGANGVGKSTLLRTLSAFQPKLGGEILIDGKEISDYGDRKLARKVSVVLTDRVDIRNLSTYDLIGLGRSPYTGFWGTLEKNDKVIVERCARQVGIEMLMGRMVHTLSDGERQKVMIAKALAQETPVIFLDEPTAFLDFPSKVDIMQLLRRLSRETHKTIFLSSHDLELALQIADKVWLMSKSESLATGSPEDLALDGRLSRFFSHRGIAFDEQTGLFRPKFEYVHSVRLTGVGQRWLMAQKALNRNCISADGSAEAEIAVDVCEHGFMVSVRGGKPEEAPTVERMLELVTAAIETSE